MADPTLISFLVARERLARGLGMTRQEAGDALEDAAAAGVVQATDASSLGRPIPPGHVGWSAADASYAAEDVNRLIADAGGTAPAVAEAKAKAGRKPEWPWEAIAFAAGRWAQANPQRSGTHTAVAAFVLEEAERLTKRRPSLKHCEDKVMEWRRILEGN
jgi:hypothetical protein